MNKSLGETLRDIRETLGLSRSDVERLSDNAFKVPILRLYERDERKISVDRFLKLCEFYGVDPADVLSPGFDVLSLKGLGSEDRKLLKNTAARLRRKSDREEKPHAS